MTAIINLTPHNIVIKDNEGKRWDHPASGTVARVSSTPGTHATNLDGIAVYKKDKFGAVSGLPDPQPGIVYIVSGMVGAAVTDRDDVLVPGTGPNDEAIRDSDGHISAVTRLKHCG